MMSFQKMYYYQVLYYFQFVNPGRPKFENNIMNDRDQMVNEAGLMG